MRGFFLYSISVATAFVAINSKTSQVDENPTFFMAYLFFYKKMKEFSQPFFKAFLAPLLILIKKGGLLQLKFGVVGVAVGVNIYLWAR